MPCYVGFLYTCRIAESSRASRPAARARRRDPWSSGDASATLEKRRFIAETLPPAIGSPGDERRRRPVSALENSTAFDRRRQDGRAARRRPRRRRPCAWTLVRRVLLALPDFCQQVGIDQSRAGTLRRRRGGMFIDNGEGAMDTCQANVHSPPGNCDPAEVGSTISASGRPTGNAAGLADQFSRERLTGLALRQRATIVVLRTPIGSRAPCGLASHSTACSSQLKPRLGRTSSFSAAVDELLANSRTLRRSRRASRRAAADSSAFATREGGSLDQLDLLEVELDRGRAAEDRDATLTFFLSKSSSSTTPLKLANGPSSTLTWSPMS